MLPWLIFAMVYAVCAILLMALAVPLMRRRVQPNSVYGLRVAATFADESVWYEANAKSGRDLFLLGASLLAAVLLLPLLPALGPDAYALILTAWVTVGALLCCLIGWRRANRLLAARRSG